MTKITKNLFREVEAMSSVSNSLNHTFGDFNSFISLLQRLNDVDSLNDLDTALEDLYDNFVDNYISSLSDEKEC